jgi:putative Holliday junction resolvase
MKYLGIDYGAKRVGTAVSNSEGTIAFPRTTFANNAKLVEEIVTMVLEEKIECIVIGDTLSHGGARNPVSDEADQFARAVGARTHLPIERQWEAGSSIEANAYVPDGKGHDDASAAAIILQRYLDMNVPEHDIE